LGGLVAILLQSSTAVALIAAGFASSGKLTLSAGLAIMLGADLGSAVVVRLLSANPAWLMPVLMIVGGLMFFHGRTRDFRQLGRVIIGIAFILISLRLIGEATAPLRDAPVLPDMGGEDAVSPGGPAEFSQGALGGFQLLEPDTDLVRYVTLLNFGGQTFSGFAEEVHQMQPDNSYQLIAVFAAPPAEVTALTLRAGPFGEIENVPFAD
jgi:hypothetical protein